MIEKALFNSCDEYHYNITLLLVLCSTYLLRLSVSNQSENT